MTHRDPMDVARGLAQDLLHNFLEHEDALERARGRNPETGPPHRCNACGRASRFHRTNPTLTTMKWCEPYYLQAMDQEGQRARFLGQKSGLARHLAKRSSR